MTTSLFEPTTTTRAPVVPTTLSIALHLALATALVTLAPLFETAKRPVLDVSVAVPLVVPLDVLRHPHQPRPRQQTRTDAIRADNAPEHTPEPRQAGVFIGALNPTASIRTPRARDAEIVIGQLNSLPSAGANAEPVDTVGVTDMFSPAVRQQGSPAAAASPADTRARLLSAPNPSYPEEAKRLGITGSVVLEVSLLSSGYVRVLRVLSALGHGFDEAAINAVSRTRCIPASKAGQAVTVTATITVVFKLT